MKLTEHQKEFILNHFFKNDIFAGWKNIATSLLDKGYSVVPGTDCIWKGGIGNFIRIEDAPEFVGCVQYIFDLNTFLSSEWFKQIKEAYLVDKTKELNEVLLIWTQITEL